jgi:hypothetical protein
MSEEHWSSPNGCHPDCPACGAECGDMERFTVIGYYDETGERYNGHIRAVTWTDAVEVAILEAGMDLVIVEVLAGHHKGLAFANLVEHACDWPVECVPGQTHLSSCDKDGYCNHCGSQEVP